MYNPQQCSTNPSSCLMKIKKSSVYLSLDSYINLKNFVIPLYQALEYKRFP